MHEQQYWLEPTPWPVPRKDTIDIFLLTMSGEVSPNEDALLLLDEHERARAERLKIPARRAEFVQVRSQLRQILALGLGIKPGDIRLTQNEHGKPMLVDTTALQFNLAHSGQRAIIAVTCGSRVGIDIEQNARNTDPLALIRRFFSKQEQTGLMAMDAEQQRNAFFDCWSRKEAFVKAEGTGIAYGLSAFSVPLGALDEPAVIHCEKSSSDWYLHELRVPEGYHAALVTDQSHMNLRYWRL